MNKKQGIFLLLLLLGGGAAAWAFTRKKDNTNTTTTDSPPPYNPPSTDFSKAVTEAIANGEKEITISLEEITNQIYKEMSWSNSDHQIILQLLEPITETHFEQMITLFGQKNYSVMSKSAGGDYGFYPEEETTPQGLVFWLQQELTHNEYEQLAQKYPKYL